MKAIRGHWNEGARREGILPATLHPCSRFGGGFPRTIRAILCALLGCIFLPAFPLSCHAAVELPEEIVEGSVIYDMLEDKYLSPGSVTVIRPEEKIGEQRTLPDLLEEVPGLRIIRLQGRHGYAVASVRGSTSSQVAVYVDGVLMNLQSESAVDLSSIPIENIERIEVYKGYVPAQFGAQAMGGVINIVTKMPEKPKTHLELGMGSFGRYKTALSHGTRMGDGKFFTAFGYETYDGDYKYWNDNGTAYNNVDDYEGRRRDNGFENMDLLLKWEDADWRARASWVHRDRDLALVAPGLDRPGVAQRPGATQETDRWDLSLGRTQMAGNVRWGWEVAYTDQQKDYDSRRGTAPSQIGGAYVTKSSYDTTRAGVSLNADLAMGDRHFMEFRAEYADERLKVGGDTLYKYLGGIGKYTSDSWSFNLQDTVALDAGGSLLLTPSIRWHEQDDDDHFTWQVALSKEFSSAWMLKTAYGTYARAPNMYERFGDGAFILPAADDLDWETGKQFDLGVLWNGTVGSARSHAGVSFFWRDSEDLIEFNIENPRYSRYKNIAKAKVKGVELETGFDWEKWNFTLTGTWMEGTNESPDDAGSVRQYGMKLPNRPEWSGTARLMRKMPKGSVFMEYQYVGENYADSSEKVLFDERNILNIGVKYELSPTTKLIAGVDDVFDDADDWRMRPDGLDGPTRMLWYPVEGRSYYLTLLMEL